MKKYLFVFLYNLTLLMIVVCYVNAENITIDVNADLGPVNRFVLGNNMLGFTWAWDPDHSTFVARDHYINGQGVWDISTYSSEPELVDFAKDIGMSYVRFPGGCGVHWYDWKKSVGPIESRPENCIDYDIYNECTSEQITYGLPEFLQNAEDIGAIPVITVSDYSGTFQDAADLVEYLNAPVGPDNPNGGIDWAQVRADDGHSEPWGVVWFEYGNETYHGDHIWPGGKKFTADQYAANYLNYQAAMKAVDPNIRLGAVLNNLRQDYDWSEIVLQAAGSSVDFVVTHCYVPWYNIEDGIPDADTLFSIGLAGANAQLESHYKHINYLVKELTGRIDVPIAVSELNGGFVQELPIPYRHTLGNALINAEQIRQMMHADNIAFGNYWQFANSYWGMIKGNSPYTLRPNYYPFMFYHQHFGDRLLAADVNVAVYETAGGYGVGQATGVHQDEMIFDTDLFAGQTWNISPISGVDASEANDILTIDFDGTADPDYAHAEKSTTVEPGAWYRLTGYVNTDELTSSEGVSLVLQGGPDQVLNGGYDDVYDPQLGWIFYEDDPASEGSLTEIDNTLSHNGSNSVRVSFDGTHDVNYYHVQQKNIAVSPDTTYMVEGYIKTENITTYQGVMIEVIDSRGWQISCWPTTVVTGTHDWTRVNVVFTTRSDANAVNIRLRRRSGAGLISGTAWFDNITLHHKIKTKTFVDTEPWRYVHGDLHAAPDINAVSAVVERAAGGGFISGKAQFKDVVLRKIIPENYGAVPYLSVNVSQSLDKSRLYLMVVNKDMIQAHAPTISLLGDIPHSARAWILNGSQTSDTNENYLNVGVTYNDIGSVTDGFVYTFPAHSLTALEIYLDSDADGIPNLNDNCPLIANANQTDSDSDGIGDACETDADADGFNETEDCNDNNPTIYPGAMEISYDGIDQNCDGSDATIVVTKAEYIPAKDKLVIEATSELGISANLSVDGIASMKWNRRLELWSLSQKGVGGNPGTVVIIGVEGFIQALVQ